MEKAIYIGTDDFTEIVNGNYYYVDKTLLIKELLDKPAKVTLFTRPRRFGKTLNTMMLRTFFENIPGNDVYFHHLKIWDSGEKYTRFQGKYPVIFLTFKDAKCDTWEETYESICRLIQKEFNRHAMLGHFESLNTYQKKQVEKILDETAGPVVYKDALGDLTEYLHQAEGVKPIILIDEYDTPIMQGHAKGFERDVITFIRNLFSGGMKNNIHLERAILTGILRIAQEDIFSGLNNIRVATLLDKDFNNYFGFTENEVKEIADYYGVPDKIFEIRKWYDGYLFGGTEIYNPWSVMNYFASGCTPGTYWTATSSNDILKDILKTASPEIITNLTTLMNGESFRAYIETQLAYGSSESENRNDTLYSLLLMSGYLREERPLDTKKVEMGLSATYDLSIPNREIAEVYRKEIFEQMTRRSITSSPHRFLEAVMFDDPDLIQEQLRELLLVNTSFHDTASESFYHALVLGLLSAVGGNYRIYSNQESGDGRYDLQLVDYDGKKGILFEFKILKGVSGTESDIMESLKRTAREAALGQMEEKHYDVGLRKCGITNIVKYGVAFCKKYVAVEKADQ